MSSITIQHFCCGLCLFLKVVQARVRTWDLSAPSELLLRPDANVNADFELRCLSLGFVACWRGGGYNIDFSTNRYLSLSAQQNDLSSS